jgi:hypothetical protein
MTQSIYSTGTTVTVVPLGTRARAPMPLTANADLHGAM